MDNKKEKSRFSYSDVFHEAGSCSHDEELLLYFQRLLSDEKKLRFEQHLNECSICSASLQDLEEMQSTTEFDGEQAKEEEFFRLERNRLRKSFLAENTRRELAVPWFTRTFSFPPALSAAMVALILLLSYPAYQFFLKKPELSMRPELTSTVILPIKLQRSPQMETIELSFNKDQRSASIVFSLPLVDYSSFAVEISKGAKPVWQEKVQTKNSRISLILHRNYFEGGVYELSVFGLSDTERVLLSRFTLNIRVQ
jgi:hypothetical protein